MIRVFRVFLLSTVFAFPVLAQSPTAVEVPTSATVSAAEHAQQIKPSEPSQASKTAPISYAYTPYKMDTALRAAAHVVLATCTDTRVEKDEQGRLWTVSDFAVNQTYKGGFEHNRFTLRIIGGAKEEPLLKEYLITGGLDLGFEKQARYVMLLNDTGMDARPIASRQQVFAVEEGSVPMIRDRKGAIITVVDSHTQKPYAAGAPVALTEFVEAIKHSLHGTAH